VIIGGDPGSAGSGGLGFPDPPTGSPGDIDGISRSLSSAADDFENVESGLRGASATLAEDWKGYAANAYHACSDGLASVARGGAASLRDCARAVSGYSRALDHAQSEIRRLRVLYEAAVAAEASAMTAASGLENRLASATKYSDITKLNSHISADQGSAANAAYSAAGYARQAAAVLEEFKQAQSRYTQLLTGATLPNGSRGPGSPFGPFAEPAGAPGPGFGLPFAGGAAMPGVLPGVYGGVIPTGNPYSNNQIPGYGPYYDAGHQNLTSPGDLTDVIAGVATLGVDLPVGAVGGALARKLAALAAEMGLGTAGREAAAQTGDDAFEQLLKEIEEKGRVPSSSSSQRAASAARERAAQAADAAQSEARAKVMDAGLNALSAGGVSLPPGVQHILVELSARGGLYLGYAVAKLVEIRNALDAVGGPAANAGIHAINGILEVISR
jgi:uncharacterized protein YukE